jgi:drug/metabolite transporter (DMT)-like permease
VLIFIILTILFATSLYIILKLFPHFRVNGFQGIVFNYFVAAIWAWFLGGSNSFSGFGSVLPFLPAAVITGLMFVIVFNLASLTTIHAGVAVTSVAGKMSMIIPIGAGMLLYQERMTAVKLTGIALALVSVYLINLDREKKKSIPFRILVLPFMLFAGSGIVDTLIKVMQEYHINADNRFLVICIIFLCAGTFGVIKLAYNVAVEGEKISARNITGGMVLGTANYFSFYYTIRCLEFPGAESSTVFAIMNSGVVLLSAVIAFFAFREKATPLKVLGVALALTAIVALYFS